MLNARVGIFMGHGPDIERVDLDERATVLDPAPTILHSAGCPVPETLDG